MYYGHVWSCIMVMYFHVLRSCGMVMYGHVWSSMVMYYGLVWSCIAVMSGHVWSRLVMFGHVQGFVWARERLRLSILSRYTSLSSRCVAVLVALGHITSAQSSREVVQK